MRESIKIEYTLCSDEFFYFTSVANNTAPCC